MAKTIRFNLICDGFPVRTLEDLQEHFSIEDVLQYYHNGLLRRWLKVRGFAAELQQVDSIDTDSDTEIIAKLAGIFEVETDEQEIAKSIYALQYRESREKRLATYQDKEADVARIIADYKKCYEGLFDSIVMAPNDIGLIKTAINNMVTDYAWALEMDHRHIFWELLDVSPLAVLCLLMNEGTRRYYLPSDDEEDYIDEDKEEMYRAVCDLINDSELKEKLGANLLFYSRDTDEFWNDLQDDSKRYLVLKIGAGDHVRSTGQRKEDYEQSDINDKFVILNGIDYKSKGNGNELLYMEV